MYMYYVTYSCFFITIALDFLFKPNRYFLLRILAANQQNLNYITLFYIYAIKNAIWYISTCFFLFLFIIQFIFLRLNKIK